MAEHNPFNKRHTEEATPSKRTLLDELNLPPKLKFFLQENSKYIQAGLFIIIVIVVAWSFYNYYTNKQKEQASTLLFKAVNQNNPKDYRQLMDQLRNKYPSTEAAVWSRVILAQRQMAENKYSEAVKHYKMIISKVEKNDVLYPLLEYGLALAYESSGQHAKAISHYKIIEDKAGFVSIACFGLARNQEALSQSAKARENYEKARAGEDIPFSVKQFIDYKLATI